MVLLGVTLGVLFFLFNAGQLVLARERLVTAADAAAYSAAVVDARFLNFQAYVNRALLADSIATAQTVSIASWLGYLGSFHQSMNPDLLGGAKYPGYTGQYKAAAKVGEALAKRRVPDPSKWATLADSSQAFDPTGLLASASLLTGAARQANAVVEQTRDQTVQAVTQANAMGAGVMRAEVLPTSVDATDFVSSGTESDRSRFATLARTLADLDSFVRSRAWVMPGEFADCPTAELGGRHDFLTRLGGTQLRGLDEWRGVDTLSEHVWIPLGPEDPECLLPMEFPVAFNSAWAQDKVMPPDLDPTHYSGSLLINPIATVMAQTDHQKNLLAAASVIGGVTAPVIPSIDALAPGQRALAQPTLGVAVRVTQSIAETGIAGARSSIVPTPALDAYQAATVSGAGLVAESRAEAYFRRPPAAPTNRYGAARGTPHEQPNLFNPYWQVRLK